MDDLSALLLDGPGRANWGRPVGHGVRAGRMPGLLLELPEGGGEGVLGPVRLALGIDQ